MRAFTALTLACLIISVSIMASPVLAFNEPSVGVKKGDWMEYTVSITCPTPAPAHNISWFRMEILDVEGAAFQANVTVRNVNGTVSSSVWDFNFTEGEVEGWVIIPANLNVGSTFYDAAKPGNVTIEGQEQKTVAGATRTITHASDSERIIKEWDKATGFYTYSLEKPKNFTVISQAIATNMWSAQVRGLGKPEFEAFLATAILVAMSIFCTAMIVLRRNGKTSQLPRFPLKGKTRAAVCFAVVLVAVGAMVLTSFFGFATGLSFHEINLLMQTFWLGLLLISMWFRAEGDYFMHGVTAIVVVVATLVDFSTVLLMTPPTGTSTEAYFSSPLNAAVFASHGVFSIPAILFGVWLVLLWRPTSASFPAKSRRIAQLTLVFWVLSYVVGVLEFLALHTTFFG